MAKTVIKVENLSKMYDLGLVGTGTLSRDLNRTWARMLGKPDPYATLAELNDRTQISKSGSVWALKDINFEVQEGEVLGIIGKNGAGKSTLLKILSQITSPTNGSIKIKGRVASLLEVGTGMHPEMTARQNIYLNGAIMGMTRREITAKFDEIVDFAGIVKYVDTPIKRFSSGMQVRLGFAVAAFLEPEVLIVDEVLAVGDAEFQKKAIGKMQDVSKEVGRTVLFVSHNMQAVNTLCKSGIVLNSGGLVFKGNAFDASRYYQNLHFETSNYWEGNEGDEHVRLLKTSIVSESEQFYTNKDLLITIEIEVLQQISNLVVGFHLLSEYNEPLAYVIHGDYNLQNRKKSEIGKHTVLFKIPANTLGKGNYTVRIDLGIHDVKFITQRIGDLMFYITNQTDLGCRYPVQDVHGYASVFRPHWEA
jgi:lipopolysaccharide transport system ATP-binding protein